MSFAEKSHAALKEWALDELKQISRRNFELAKFFFAISAASFAIVPLSNVQIHSSEWWKLLAIVPLGASVILSIVMASPANFKINQETNFEDEHRKFARRSKFIRHSWIAAWIVGIISILAAFGGLIELESSSDVAHVTNTSD